MKTLARLTAPITALLAFAPLAHASSLFVGFSFGSGGLGGAGSCLGSICSVANTILYLINYVAVPVLFAVAFIVFLYGIAKAYIFTGGEEAVSSGHKLVLWGIIGFAVMISLWGLVNVVSSTFGLAGYPAPALPTSTGGYGY